MGPLLEFFKTVDVTGAVMIGMLVLIALVIGLLAVFDRQKNRQLRDAMENGQSVIGWIVHPDQVGNGNVAAQVLLTFEKLPKDNNLLDRLAKRVVAIMQHGGKDEIEKKIASLMTNYGHLPDRRVRLPAEFTGGPVIYSCHVVVQREHLPNGKLAEPYVCCKALPGDEGPVFMVAYSA